jgi:GTP-binding protein
VKILSAEFVTSAVAGRPVSRDADAEVALVGRSNVGKSSLINALCRTKVARTSAAPGKTRLANVYRVHLEGLGGPGRQTVYFVDLPGYGYARGGADSAKELAAVAEAYLRARSDPGPRTPAPGLRTQAPRGTLLLVDSRHPGLDTDRHAFDWLARAGMGPRVVATKIDKLSRAERTRNLREFERTFGTAALPVSAATGEGLDQLWKLIVAST